MTSVRVRIRGRVQGVGFRMAAYDFALSLGIKGWVRNTPDGSVEALLQGSSAQVERMIEWCRVGPRLAKVDSVELSDSPGEICRDFSISG